jgi:hypothetical protein
LARVLLTIAVYCAAAVLAGCSGGAPDLRDLNPLANAGDSTLKPGNFFKFKTPEWARTNSAENIHLSATAPVPTDQLVSPAGQCAAVAEAPKPIPAPAAPQSAAAPPPDRLEPAGAAAPAAPVLGGGIGLGMTECTVVRRAGTPNQVTISAGKKGEREAVLTYTSGERPGIYRFVNGRLKMIDALPEQAVAEKKSKRRTARKSARKPHGRTAQRMYVQ